MTAIDRPTPRSQQFVSLVAERRSALTRLHFATTSTELLFWKSEIIAALSGGIVFFHCEPGAQQRAVNTWCALAPHCNMSADEFDFIVGQVLTQAGLPLTRRSTEEAPNGR